MMKAMRALYWVIKEDVALRKWHSLKDIFSQVGVDLSPLECGTVKYNSEGTLAELVDVFARVVRTQTDDLISKSTLVGVTADEATDVSNVIQVDTHLRLVHSGQVKTRFGALQAVSNKTADELTPAITDWCASRKIDMDRKHFGTDGSANWTGCHSGVATRLKASHPTLRHVHCVAHREASAALDHVSQFLTCTTRFNLFLEESLGFSMLLLCARHHCTTSSCC